MASGRAKTLVGSLVMCVVAIGCSSADNGPGPPPSATSCSTKASADQLKAIDSNGDGKLVVGVATPGPRDDGAYYQALVECVDRLAKANGGSPIVVDKIAAPDAATQNENLAKQDPHVTAIGPRETGIPR